MTYQRRVIRRGAEPSSDPNIGGEIVESTSTTMPSGGELARRVIVLLFGVIQILVLLRIGLLLLNAREANDLVRFVLDVSQLFVAPFLGIFRADALHSGGSVFDVAAVAALVGWTILEAIALWIVNVFRREPA